MLLENVKIKTKLLGSFIIVSIIAGIIGFVGYKGMKDIKATQDEVVVVRVPSVVSLLKISKEQVNVWVAERGLSNRRMMDPEVRNAQYKWIDNALIRAQEAWDIYEPLPQTEEEAVEWKKFVGYWDIWKKDHQLVYELSKEKDELFAQGYGKDEQIKF